MTMQADSAHDDKIIELREQGKTSRDISEALGLRHEPILQRINNLTRRGILKPLRQITGQNAGPIRSAIINADDPKDFQDWVDCAVPGDRRTYFRGYLTAACQYEAVAEHRHVEGYMRGATARRIAGPIASMARAIADEGMVALTQLRHGDFDYEYIATRTIPKPKRIRLWDRRR